MKLKIPQIEKRIGYSFKQKELLVQALTHSSYAYENPQGTHADNEVLEFLGDSVVGLIIADFFFSAYPNHSEGELSKLKSTAASTIFLSEYAKKVKIDRQILLGKGEEKSGGRKKRTILAGAFEALVGAVYIDGGFEEAKNFLLNLLDTSFRIIKNDKFLINNYKSALQEYFQKESLPSPSYRTIMSKGPDHRKNFVVEVCLDEKSLATAKGPSKKIAEQKAAEKALKGLMGRKMKSLIQGTFILKK